MTGSAGEANANAAFLLPPYFSSITQTSLSWEPTVK